jgi:leucyl-tRNA---protein transferase
LGRRLDPHAYKTAFRPLERLGRDGWRRMEEIELVNAKRHPAVLPSRGDPKRLLIKA